MSSAIAWLEDWQAALDRAKAEDKPIFLDFFLPTCIGCRQMGEVTYPDDRVQAIIGQEFVPVKQSPDAEPISDDFWVRWTPALFVCDPYGNPHQRLVGFLPPEQLIPYLLLGKGKTLFDHRRFNDALACFERLISDWPQSFAAPQAIYHRAICRYRTTQDPHHLKIGHQILKAEYPDSEWAVRSLPYRLID